MRAKDKISQDHLNPTDANNQFATNSALFSELKSNRNSNVHITKIDKFSTDRNSLKNSSDIMKALYADRNNSKPRKVIFYFNKIFYISNFILVKYYKEFGKHELF